MSTHSGSLAVGELIGAAGFITAVVAGSMALVRPFRVAKRSFVRDVGFFIIAASFSMVFVADGNLQIWECATMIAFYLFYVLVVAAWHWRTKRQNRCNVREVRARAHFIHPDGVEAREVEDFHEGFHVEDNDALASQGDVVDDFTMLERASEHEDDARDRYMAEISRNMRIRRPLSRHRRNTGNPIRPSLVGALEFRAVLSALEKSGTQQTTPINLRRYSDDPTFTLTYQQKVASRSRSNPHVDQLPKDSHEGAGQSPRRLYEDDEHRARTRAVSMNDALDLREELQAPEINFRGPGIFGSTRHDMSSSPVWMSNKASSDLLAPNSNDSKAMSPSRRVKDVYEEPATLSRTPSIHLALSSADEPSRSSPLDPNQRAGYATSSHSHDGLLHPPSRQSTAASQLLSPGTIESSPAIAFPPYHDDPNFILTPPRAPSIRLSPPSLDSEPRLARFNVNPAPPKIVRWWPYRLLPSPEVLAATLFPTICSWKEKTIGEKILGLLAAPSVFLLTATLPVVESEKDDMNTISASADPELSSQYSHDSISRSTIVPTLMSGEHISPDNDEHRPSERMEGLVDNNLTALKPPGKLNISLSEPVPRPETVHQQDRSPSRQETVESADSITPVSVDQGWNRWLVCTQVFTAPLFVVLIVWANVDDDLSLRTLTISFAYTMIGSLLALSLLLLTTTEARAPRYRPVLCFVGFVVSVAWISTIANEVVGVLMALGVILGISDAILGLTIFAVGNRYESSVRYHLLVANLTLVLVI